MRKTLGLLLLLASSFAWGLQAYGPSRPIGPASGSLGGSYPNPTLASVVNDTVTWTAQQVYTAPWTLQSSGTVTANAFSVGSSTLVVTTGNVGVGTATPAAILDVQQTGTANSTIAKFSEPSLANGNSGTISLSGGGGTPAGLKLVFTKGSLGSSSSYIQDAGAGTSPGLLFISGSPAATSLGTNMGASPQSTLEIQGNLEVGAAYNGAATNTTDGLIVAGNVGIGTASPKWPLQVQGAADATGQLIVGGTATVSGSAFSVGISTLVVANGNVGIGTASPRLTLDVIGGISASNSTNGYGFNGNPATLGGMFTSGSSLALRSAAANASLLFQDSTGNQFLGIVSGNVGIGTASPVGILDITSTTSGAGIPSLTTAQVQAAAPGRTGMIIYNSTAKEVCVSTGTAANSWEIVGNTLLQACQ